MKRDDTVYILHAIDAAEKAIDFTAGMTRTVLDSDEKLALAIVRLLEIIGEASSCISETTKDSYPHIPWRKMTAMRNRLIHGYFDINYDIVWDTVKNDLPGLISLLKSIN